jgi:hypothetical protein
MLEKKIIENFPHHRIKSATATSTWLVLIAATVFSWWLAKSHSLAEQLTGRGTEHTVIIALGIFKMYLVMAVFMGLWRAPAFWHIYSLILLLIIGGLMMFFSVAP